MSRSRWITPHTRLALLPILGACLFLIAGDPAVISSQEQADGDDDLAATASKRDDPVVVALDEARRAYLRGDFEAARSWFNAATALFEQVAPPVSPNQRWPRSNADQLLVSLQLYDWYARGQDLELDAQYDALVDWLGDIDVLNRSPTGPRGLRGLDVRYDLFSHLVREIGDLRIDYDLFTAQISRVGPYRIDYDLFTRNPRKIGGIEIEYDLFDHLPNEIAGVRIR